MISLLVTAHGRSFIDELEALEADKQVGWMAMYASYYSASRVSRGTLTPPHLALQWFRPNHDPHTDGDHVAKRGWVYNAISEKYLPLCST